MTVQTPDKPITAVFFPESGWFFPESGWASMVALMADGSGVEVGIVGFEGMAGVPLLLGSDRAPIEAMIQAPGTVLRLGAAFQENSSAALPCGSCCCATSWHSRPRSRRPRPATGVTPWISALRDGC